MTFRGRLRVFFAMIVLVPMLAIGIALLAITASNERGKADAALAVALTVAFEAYEDGRLAARDELRGVASDRALTAALARGDRAAVARRLAALVRRDPQLVSASVAPVDGAPIAAGSARSVAPASASLTRDGGGRLGTLSVSATDAPALARTVRARTRDELLVLRNGRAVASTVPAVRSAPAGSADFEAGGTDYRSRRETVLNRPRRTEQLAVFTDASDINESITRDRLLVCALLLAFLLLALAGSVVRVQGAAVSDRQVPGRRPPAGRRPLRRAGAGRGRRRVRAARPRVQQHVAAAREPDRGGPAQATRAGGRDPPGRRGVRGRARPPGQSSSSLVENAVEACEAEGGRAVPLVTSILEEVPAGAQDADLVAVMDQAERRGLRRAPGRARRRRGPVRARDRGAGEGAAGHAVERAPVGIVSLARRDRAFTAEEAGPARVPHRPGGDLDRERGPPRDRPAPGDHRRAHRALQRPPDARRAGPGVRARPALQHPGRVRAARHRRLQAGERHLRPPAGRRGAHRGGRGAARALARHRRARPLRRRGDGGGAPPDRARRCRPAGRAHARGDRGAADPAPRRRGRSAGDRQLRRGLGALQRFRQGVADRRGRRRAVPRQAAPARTGSSGPSRRRAERPA